eukprot:Phypoly_transcript_03932.p1 GENE.Phypoly_transcript_03932~~Phypoly_transcript_03932.p1  ORF type:complete len:464 (-),score=71.66 Phypoly_transcript_03932:802-2193(-)
MDSEHLNISCDVCHASPIVGVRYKCANCADYDLCEICESRNAHDPTHLFLKIKLPLPAIVQKVMIPFSLYNIPTITQSPALISSSTSPSFSRETLRSSSFLQSSRALMPLKEPTTMPPTISPKFPTLPLVPFFDSAPMSPKPSRQPSRAASVSVLSTSTPITESKSSSSPLLRFLPFRSSSGILKGSAGMLKEKDMAKIINDFGFRVVNVMQQRAMKYHENFFISPFELKMSLMLAANGSNDDTYQEIARVLGHTNLDLQTLNITLKTYRTVLGTNDPEFCSASSLWTATGVVVKPQFAAAMSDFYNSDCVTTEKADPNIWISEKTNSKAVSLAFPSEVSSSMLVGVAGFKCKWRKTFEQQMEDMFDSGRVKCKYMKSHGDFQYYEDSNGLQAIALPHIGHTRAVLILPPEPQNASSFVGSLDGTQWARILGSLHHKEGTIILPRFRVEYPVIFHFFSFFYFV